MTAPQIPIYSGEVPQRTGQTQEQFSTNMNDWVSYYNVSIPDVNTLATFVNDSALEVESSLQIIQTVVSQQNFLGEWDDLTGSVDAGSTLYHNGVYWAILVDIADVTASEPSLVNNDYALAPQVSDRTVIQSPFSLTITGRYFILGDDIITIPNPSTYSDGQSWDFAREKGSEPTVQVGVGVDVFKFDNFPDDDGVVLDSVPQVELVVRNGFYEV